MVMAPNDYVKAKKSTLEDCLTCPLCLNLFEEATTSCLCLHTFCKKCIYQKLEEDQRNRCPLCNEYFGPYPEEKLRPDNNLQELKNKIFPYKKTRDVKSTVTPAAQIKAALSSLPPIAPKSRRTRANLRTTKVAAENDKIEHLGTISVFNTSTKPPVVHNKQRIEVEEGLSRGGKTKMHKHGKPEKLSVPEETSNGHEDVKGSSSCLPEVFPDEEQPNKKIIPTKTRRRSRKNIPVKSPSLVDLNKKLESEPETESQPSTSDAFKLKNSSEQRFGASGSKRIEEEPLTRLYPVWFTLQACDNKSGESYPQIPKPYIKINDGNMPVSSLNKYLVQKLNLKHESEVEVMCCGQSLVPTATLNSITEIWVKNNKGHIRRSSADAQNFIMILTYSKR